MTDDLLTFENTLAVLAEYGEAVAAAYKDNLRRDGRPASHALEQSITTFVTTDHGDFVVKMNLNDYWKYIEYGTKGWFTGNTSRKMPPVSTILKWIEIKPVIPRPDSKGRIPSPQSLAFLIARKIRNFGTKGRADLTEAKMTTEAAWRERIEAALGHDLEHYIRKVLVVNVK
jgi:hypothetical protein